MIEAVFVFGIINVVFEWVVLCMLPVRTRLRLLGNPAAELATHVMIMILILTVHWGTLVGSMSGFFSFCLSILVFYAAKVVFGSIKDGRYYTTGWIRYSAKELT